MEYKFKKPKCEPCEMHDRILQAKDGDVVAVPEKCVSCDYYLSNYKGRMLQMKKLTEENNQVLMASTNNREQEITLLLPTFNRFVSSYLKSNDSITKGWLKRVRGKLNRIEKTLKDVNKKAVGGLEVEK